MILFVGEQSGGTVARPAFGYPVGSAQRLAKMLGMSHEEMLDRYGFENLLSPGSWDRVRASRAADIVTDDYIYDKVVLLGKKVTEAFGFEYRPLRVGVLRGRGRPPALIFPHPSGRNRLFNDSEFRRRCERALRRFVR